jgi:hypothetical protein
MILADPTFVHVIADCIAGDLPSRHHRPQDQASGYTQGTTCGTRMNTTKIPLTECICFPMPCYCGPGE